MTVHVVVLNWNEAALTARCLESLAALRGPAPVVHLVDNGSTEAGSADIARRFPDLVLHRLRENRGYAGGANVGIRAALAAGAEWVFLLNNDCVLDPAALTSLLEASRRHPECGIYTGKIYENRRDRILWCCGCRLGYWPNLCRMRGHRAKDRGQHDREEKLPLVTGCALLVARRVFETVGLLDETFFLYVEDADFCARAVRAGFMPLYVPSSVVEHAGSASTGGGYSPVRKYLNAHGAITYLRRHGTFVLWGGFLLLDVAGWPLALLRGVFNGRLEGVLAKGRGLRDGFLGRPQDLRFLRPRPVRPAP